jgi:PTH1 family peptidyl-tRNA hydrolase
VVGLGNPGPGYAGNRHNIGQMVVAELAARGSMRFTSHKANARVAEGRIAPGGPRFVLALPNTYMNVSGGPVNALAKFYKIDPANVIIVHDELDIPFDSIKLKVGGGHGGHNGVRDSASALATPEFVRVRVGIGRPPGRQDAADFVLRDFSSDEKKVVPNLISDAADAVEQVAGEGLIAAQLRFHTARD